jgi:hypothetical protein
LSVEKLNVASNAPIELVVVNLLTFVVAALCLPTPEPTEKSAADPPAFDHA